MQPNLKNKNGELPRGQAASPLNAEGLHLRAQTAQESLGLAGKGGLFKASIQASVLFAIVFAVLTFVPYFLEGQKSAAKPNTPAPEQVDPAPTPTPVNPDPSPKTPISPNPKVSGKEEFLIKGGETGTKSGTPKPKDPFGTGTDDLPGLK